jgi:hypothetical protein
VRTTMGAWDEDGRADARWARRTACFRENWVERSIISLGVKMKLCLGRRGVNNAELCLKQDGV